MLFGFYDSRIKFHVNCIKILFQGKVRKNSTHRRETKGLNYDLLFETSNQVFFRNQKALIRFRWGLVPCLVTRQDVKRYLITIRNTK